MSSKKTKNVEVFRILKLSQS